MASEVISSALLMIATIVATVALINAVIPSIYSMSGSITSVTHSVNEQMKTDVKFIYETTDDSNHLTAWVKNTGQTQIPLTNFNRTDVFYGDANGAMARAQLNSTDYPAWTFSLENDNGNGQWDPGETIRLDITAPVDQPFVTGTDYKVRLTLYNGAFCEDYFTK